MSVVPTSQEECSEDGIVRGTLATVRLITSKDDHSDNGQSRIAGMRVMKGGTELSRDHIKATNPIFAEKRNGIYNPGPSTETANTPGDDHKESLSSITSGTVRSVKPSRIPRPVQGSSRRAKSDVLDTKVEDQTEDSSPPTITTFRLGDPNRPQWMICFGRSDQGGYPTGATLSQGGSVSY